MGAKWDRDLSHLYGLSQNTISTWKERNAINWALVFKHLPDNVNLNHLIKGEAEPGNSEIVSEGHNHYGGFMRNINGPHLVRINRQITIANIENSMSGEDVIKVTDQVANKLKTADEAQSIEIIAQIDNSATEL
jgi:hypothetical protein